MKIFLLVKYNTEQHHFSPVMTDKQVSCLVSVLLSQKGIRRIDRYPALPPKPDSPRGLLPNPIRDLLRLVVAGRRSQNADKKR